MTTLYYFAGACSLVPHIVARELSLDISVKAAPRPDDAGRAEYLDEINSLGKVPALQLDDAQVITQNEADFPVMKDMAIELLSDLYAHVDGEYATKDWIANNQYSAADIYIYVTYRWALRMGVDLSPFNGLKKMVAAIQARPAVIQALAEQGVPAI